MDSKGMDLTIVCVLFDPPNGRKAGAGGSAGWGIYSPEWADKLYRGFQRNLKAPFEMLCLTDYAQEDFREPIQVEPFIFPDHVGEWMSITEIFRPDLLIDRGIFCGLDTVITGDITPLAEYSGALAMTADATGVGAHSNAVVLFDGSVTPHLWSNYADDPHAAAMRNKAPWSAGMGSEMLYWRREAECSIDTIQSEFPSVGIYDYCEIGRGGPPEEEVDIMYFHGSKKPNNINEQWILKNWQ